MPLVVGTNTSAQFAQDALRANQRKTATAMERLSTGLRINSAKDDAAGLAISQSMTSQIRGLNQAVRNINDGINLLQTAEGGLSSITDMLQRMRELALQSVNGTNSDAQRAYLQKEAAALQEQISKVVDTTTWNDKKLLDGSFTAQKIQVGAASGATMEVSIPTLPSVSSTTTNTYHSALTGSIVGTAALASGQLSINGAPIGSAASADAKALAYAINSQTSTTGVVASAHETHAVSEVPVQPQVPAAVIDLDINGKLIFPVVVDGGHYFYFWDRDGDGTANQWDLMQRASTQTINTLLADINGNYGGVAYHTDTYRYGTLNGIKVALPTAGGIGGVAGYPMGLEAQQLATSVGSYSTWQSTSDPVVSQGSNEVNSKYDDYLAIWDAYNGTSTGQGPNGTPPGWKGTDPGRGYWTSTNSPFGWVRLGTGQVYQNNDSDNYAALEVINPPMTPGNFEVITSGDIRINGVGIGAIAPASTTGERMIQVATAINAQSATTGVSAVPDVSTGGITLKAADGRNIEISTLTSAAINGSKIGISLSGQVVGDRTVTTYRSTIELSSSSPTGLTITASAGGPSSSGIASGSTPATITTTVSNSTIDISTQQGASSAIGVIDSTLESVNSARSTIGSYINRLSYAADNAANISTNLSASRSAIMDTDYAEESANLAKSQIVQQAATAMLAQANQQPQSVLALLKNL